MKSLMADKDMGITVKDIFVHFLKQLNITEMYEKVVKKTDALRFFWGINSFIFWKNNF